MSTGDEGNGNQNTETRFDDLVERAARPLEGAVQAAARPFSAAAGKVTKGFTAFARLEASGGIALVLAAAAAMVIANTQWAEIYHQTLNAPFGVVVGEYALKKTVLHWINDGLMTLFFFLVGLEVKREIMEGELKTPAQAILPLVAAIGGMVVPALIYTAVTGGDPATYNGWAIPTATDIAFALGILMLLGNRVPVALKAFLLAVAIFDDIGAILIISLFYTNGLATTPLMVAGGAVVALFLANLAGNRHPVVYFVIGFVLWFAVLKSGVHATLAGVITALAVPIKRVDGHSPLHEVEHALHPFVAFFILPVFAFANAGVTLSGGVSALMAPVTLGIVAGLVVGKTLGVFGSAFIAVKLGLARLPGSITWPMVLGASLLSGIGFTMSLFIGTLAFPANNFADEVRLGVLMASLMAATIGVIVLAMVLPARQAASGPGTSADSA